MVRPIFLFLHFLGAVVHAAELGSQHQFLESHPSIFEASEQKAEGHENLRDSAFRQETKDSLLKSRRLQGPGGRIDEYFNFTLAITPGEDSDESLCMLADQNLLRNEVDLLLLTFGSDSISDIRGDIAAAVCTHPPLSGSLNQKNRRARSRQAWVWTGSGGCRSCSSDNKDVGTFPPQPSTAPLGIFIPKRPMPPSLILSPIANAIDSPVAPFMPTAFSEEGNVIEVGPLIPPKPTTRKPTTRKPTLKPTTKLPTTRKPTLKPTTKVPTTRNPTLKPTTISPPTRNPTSVTTTRNPTLKPTTKSPTTRNPTLKPTTMKPTSNPTTKNPTLKPTTLSPTTRKPTSYPTSFPTTRNPTASTIFIPRDPILSRLHRKVKEIPATPSISAHLPRGLQSEDLITIIKRNLYELTLDQIVPKHLQCLGSSPEIIIEVSKTGISDLSANCSDSIVPVLSVSNLEKGILNDYALESCQRCSSLDFSSKGATEKIIHGSYVKSQWRDSLGVTITAKSNGGGQARIYNTSLPVVNDQGNIDLGSPNKYCGGFGVGLGGEPGQPGENCVPVQSKLSN
jgi:hypothetical protein